ncbi:MAG: TonB-dependent receptor, partial [Piscirickettsiaceae bacterium CG_4_9_14_3_um_filter_43_564]
MTLKPLPLQTKLSKLSFTLIIAGLSPLTISQASDTSTPLVMAPVIVESSLRASQSDDLAASHSIINAQTLLEKGASHFDDILLQTPNVNFSGQSSRARHIQIRGIGELDDYTGAPNPSVGVSIDNIDFSGIGMTANLFDVKQVEVLRGPQSSRYGNSALAGLIHIQSNDPTPYRENRIETTIGTDQLREVGLMTSGPFSSAKDSGQYRIAIQKHLSDGFMKNDYLNRTDTNGKDEL